LNQFIEEHGFDWTKYKSVATSVAAVMQGSNGVVRKFKNVSHDCVSNWDFFGDFSVIDQSFFK